MIWVIILSSVFISGFVTGIGVTILWDAWDRKAQDSYDQDRKKARKEGYDWS